MTNETWAVRDILQWTSQRFGQRDVATPLLDAQLLLGEVLGASKVQLYMHMDRVLTPDERSRMRDLVKRRVSGEPVAYLLGRKSWHELELAVDGRVLIPRPETETLLDFVLAVFRAAAAKPLRVLDLCTGSGCLAIALAKRFPDAHVMAVDVSEDALAVARSNARLNGVSNVTFVRGDVSEGDGLLSRLRVECAAVIDGFDVIVANPPYVSEDEWKTCDVGVRDFEPKLALTAADDGLALARVIAEGVARVGMLSHHSVFAMEVGLAHCARLASERASLDIDGAVALAEDGSPLAFPYNAQSRRYPRGAAFALQDLTGRDRFWCRVNGLSQAEPRPMGATAYAGDADGVGAAGADTSEEALDKVRAAADAAKQDAYERARRDAEALMLASHAEDAEGEPEA
jgi:release factor glutamine methyltransferase